MNNKSSAWPSALSWVRFYSFITVAGVIYGLGAAHLPSLLGTSWSSCEVSGSKLACVLALHLYEVPLTAYNFFIAWYGLKRFSPDTIQQFLSLLTFGVMANLVFFTFECQLVVDLLRRQAPEWESLVASSIALMLIFGAGLGVHVKHKLIPLEGQGR
jgi:hypothetical protein